MFFRYYQTIIDQYLKPNKVLVLYGPRQVGKTTLIRNFLASYEGKVYRSTGDDTRLRELLEKPSITSLETYFSAYDLVFIDEAQRIDNIGLALKLMVDHLEDIRIIATGSSSFDLSNKVGEPLVGRQYVLRLHPIALLELDEQFGWASVEDHMENYLIYGLYPETVNLQGVQHKEDYLYQLRDGYLYKDILELESLRNPGKIMDLLRLIAFQIGKEVSIEELGNQLGMSKNTVVRYLDLLEKVFVLIKVRGFSRNLRKEVTKSPRFYFYDNGVRNAVINNFQPLKNRNDVEQLWENFVFTERLKKRTYHRIHANTYFWRTYQQKEIDLVEEREGGLFGYEFKYNPKSFKPPKDWLNAYPEASLDVINRKNLKEFVT